MENKISNSPIWDKTNQWFSELELLNSIVLQKNLSHTTKWGGSVYTFQNKNILGISGFKNFFTIWFFKGIFLKDSANKLINAQEGVTKSMRQWRFFSKSEIDPALISAYIDEAILIEIQGKKTPKHPKTVVIPAILENELRQNPDLKMSYEKLSEGKKYEYSSFIAEAKKTKTQLIRLEKIISKMNIINL